MRGTVPSLYSIWGSQRAEECPKEETSMKQVVGRAGVMLGLFFFPEDGGYMFLRNFC
jgi:hypothetical protein